MSLSTGQEFLLKTLWALGTGCLLGASLAVMVASVLVPVPASLLWKLLVASGLAFVIHLKLNKETD